MAQLWVIDVVTNSPEISTYPRRQDYILAVHSRSIGCFYRPTGPMSRNHQACNVHSVVHCYGLVGKVYGEQGSCYSSLKAPAIGIAIVHTGHTATTSRTRYS